MRKTYKYGIKLTFNEQIMRKRTNDIKEAFMSAKPDILKSNVVITVTAGGKKVEKLLFLRQANRAFRNPIAAEILEKQILILL